MPHVRVEEECANCKTKFMTRRFWMKKIFFCKSCQYFRRKLIQDMK